MNTIECTGYIEIEPEISNTGNRVWRAAVRKATQKRPKVTNQGSVIVKVTFRIPEAAFLPLAPAAVIEVPADFVTQVVEVEATDASEQ